MTVYENLMNKSALCYARGEKSVDKWMRLFWFNASKGFEIKARNLSVKEAKTELDPMRFVRG